MKKTFNFGKIAFYGTRKINAVTVEVRYENGVFAASGDIWNGHHTDIVCGGQCLDTIKEYINDPLFIRIYNIWKEWHLNDMHAGTEAQEKILNDYFKDGKRYDYKTACEVLGAHGMLNDNKYIYNGKPYRYGTAWLKREIPANIKAEIAEILIG